MKAKVSPSYHDTIHMSFNTQYWIFYCIEIVAALYTDETQIDTVSQKFTLCFHFLPIQCVIFPMYPAMLLLRR